MTKWKQQIDDEIGNDSKFSSALAQKILQKSSNKKKRSVGIPFAFVGACLVGILLFLTAPSPLEESQQTSSSPITLANIMKEDRINTVYMSYYTSYETKFFSRDNTLALGVKKLNRADMLKVEELMKSLRLERSVPFRSEVGSLYPYGKDLIIEFESGLRKKIRADLQYSNTQISDPETQLMYSSPMNSAEVFANYYQSYKIALFVSSILMLLSYVFISVQLKNRAPDTVKIYLQFVGLIIVIVLLLTQNIILTIWLPVVYLIIRVWIRYFKLRNENDSLETLKKMKRSTILLTVMWAALFIQQLVGGI